MPVDPQFVPSLLSGLRRVRPTVPVDSTIAETLSHPPHQESGLIMREFLTAFSKLAPTQREALLLAVVEGLPYETIAAHTNVSVGTVKSRISRARDRLEHLLIDGDVQQQSADIADGDTSTAESPSAPL